MCTRLPFPIVTAVAQETLMVDEVLSTGDRELVAACAEPQVARRTATRTTQPKATTRAAAKRGAS